MATIDQIFINIEKGFEKQAEKKISKAVSKLFNEIVDRTPVDTGALHKAWEIDMGRGYIKPRTNWQAKGDFSITFKQDTTITIRNRQSYAYFIEYGHSQQAPSGMLRISAKNFRNYLKL